MTLSWRYAAASDVGLLREGNEDSAFAGRRLLAVADGMGGHAAGEVASAAVIAALEQLDELGVDAGDPQEALREAVAEANAHLRDMVAADNELQGMGTTVTAVLTDGDYTWLAHIGDSRAYLLRDGELHQLTRDHTYVQQLVDEGRLAPADVSTHPQRNVITRALDGRQDVDVDLERLDLRAGDRLLLCSDGLSGVVSDESMAEVLTGTTPEDAVQRLVDLALRGGGPDNITCIVADPVESALAPAATVAGAAGDAAGTDGVRGARTESPATRAAALPRRGAATREPVREPAREADGPDPRAKARRLRRRRTAVVGIAAVALVAATATAGWSWTQRQYYVGAADSQVAIYRGVEGSVAGIELSHVTRTVPLALADLPDFERKRVADGIHASGLADAQRIVDRLRDAVPPVLCATPSPTPKPTPKPSAKTGVTPKPTVHTSPTPSPKPSVSAKPTVTPATPTPSCSPTPTPGPTP
jgi:serine/threonine protein phosphatase PrpC